MPARFASGRRRERRHAPWLGYKLACPMLSGDGGRSGFAGVALGRSLPYGPVAGAVCALGGRHRSPSRWCDCGFYCFHHRAEAEALACDPDYRGYVLLEVQATGRYIRYEKGLRYARQRVTAMSAGRCGCGRSGELLAETGDGIVGWRQLASACTACLGSCPAISVAEFATLLGGLPLRSVEPATPLVGQSPAATEEQLITLISAEIALLHGRLDHLQSQLDQLGRAR